MGNVQLAPQLLACKGNSLPIECPEKATLQGHGEFHLNSLAEWMAKKSPHFIYTTKVVFPKSLKFMNSGSEKRMVAFSALWVVFWSPGATKWPSPSDSSPCCVGVRGNDSSVHPLCGRLAPGVRNQPTFCCLEAGKALRSSACFRGATQRLKVLFYVMCAFLRQHDIPATHHSQTASQESPSRGSSPISELVPISISFCPFIGGLDRWFGGYGVALQLPCTRTRGPFKSKYEPAGSNPPKSLQSAAT